MNLDVVLLYAFTYNCAYIARKLELSLINMVDFALALPDEVCQELGQRARLRRVALNISVEELAKRVGISTNTLGNFERTGRCTLATFARVLEVLNALPDLAAVLVTHSRTIEDMRQKASVDNKQRAYTRKKAVP